MCNVVKEKQLAAFRRPADTLGVVYSRNKPQKKDIQASNPAI